MQRETAGSADGVVTVLREPRYQYAEKPSHPNDAATDDQGYTISVVFRNEVEIFGAGNARASGFVVLNHMAAVNPELAVEGTPCTVSFDPTRPRGQRVVFATPQGRVAVP